jgi:hypothetical protein
LLPASTTENLSEAAGAENIRKLQQYYRLARFSYAVLCFPNNKKLQELVGEQYNQGGSSNEFS